MLINLVIIIIYCIIIPLKLFFVLLNCIDIPNVYKFLLYSLTGFMLMWNYNRASVEFIHDCIRFKKPKD